MIPPPPDLGRPIEDQIDQFRGWVRHGCPLRSEPTPLLQRLVEACTHSKASHLHALASHDCAWVRLGVACNKHTRRWTLWGDGLTTFGLAADDEPWVAASVLLRTGRPPAEIVSAVRAAALSTSPAAS